MYGGREKLHVLLQWEKTCICPSGKAVNKQHIYCLASMRSKYHFEFMGWDGLLLLNISHNNISKIADYGFFNLNQLRELDISKNTIVNFPVHVFQGFICLKEVN